MLPPDWVTALDRQSGRTYYYNQSTRATTWTFPDPADATEAKGKGKNEEELARPLETRARLVADLEEIKEKEKEERLQREFEAAQAAQVPSMRYCTRPKPLTTTRPT